MSKDRGLHARCYVRQMVLPCVWCGRLFRPYVDFPWYSKSKACGACSAAAYRDRKLERYPEHLIPPVYMLTPTSVERAMETLKSYPTHGIYATRGNYSARASYPTCEQLFGEIFYVRQFKLKKAAAWR
jgi:hypothetical protein